jgi:murein DD-endopeptidase MepM/ murein hydrolase activator NlpD
MSAGTSRLRTALGAVLVLVVSLIAAGTVGAGPAHATGSGILLNLPLPLGTEVKASGPHSDNSDPNTGTFNAVDLGAVNNDSGNTPVDAAAAGTVVSVTGYDGYPRCIVEIQHADGWKTRYLHLIHVPSWINKDVKVSAGDWIGDAGYGGVDTCGHATARHVHFSLYKDGSPVSIDGTSIGGFTVHASGGMRCGWWTDDDTESTVFDARSACAMVDGVGNTRVYNNSQPASAMARASGSAVVTDQSGRVWSFAVTQAGVLKYRYTDSSGWASWTTVGAGYLAVAATMDGNHNILMAYITDDNVLHYRTTKSPPTSSSDVSGFGASQTRGAGNWANLTVTTDRTGSVWLAATKTDGGLWYMHQASNGAFPAGFSEYGNGDWTSASLANESGGRVWLFAVANNGELSYAHTDQNLNPWDASTDVGSGWSSVAAAGDTAGEVWMYAVTSGGRLEYRHTLSTSPFWSGFTVISDSGFGDRGWADASAAVKPVTGDADGQQWMFATRTNGDLYYRHTQSGTPPWTDLAGVAGGPWE